jgi:phosphate acetyltransferase
LLFPEATDARVLSAVEFLAARAIARPVLVGDAAAIRAAAEENGFSLAGVDVRDVRSHPRRAEFAEDLFAHRQSKGMTREGAVAHLEDPLYVAAQALKFGEADGLVAGAVRTTADTVRAGFSCLGTAHGHEVAFGVFLMECPHADGGSRRLLFADAAVSPRPSARSLASVGATAARLFQDWVGEPARVAFLSFSTKGSAEDESVELVRHAVETLHRRSPEVVADGELQGDAALVDHIAAQKGAGTSSVAGRSNVLVFPDLNAGNIAYKLVQHLGGARAVGPLLPGLARPMTDLSRGCTDEDIVDAAALVSRL